MAGRRAVRKSKKARCGESREDTNAIDRLSDFPDAVLHRILSRVPIKDAVRTSLLSKRWQHLWLSIPKLAFSQHQFRKRSNFMNLVDRALLLRDSSVEEFTLSCDVKDDMARINLWIASVVMRNVQKLCLNIYLGCGLERVVFPSSLFRCETLTRLEIRFKWPRDLIMPSSVCLSSLKDLIFGRVQFLDYRSVQNLLLSCPALEDLSIDECHWIDVNGKTISAPNLQRLTIRDSYSHGLGAGECCSGKVVINGPNVKFFDYSSTHYYSYGLVDSSFLNEARLINSHRPTSLDLDVFSDLIRGLCNVRILTLGSLLFSGLKGEDVFQGWPIFSNMTKLKLEGHVFLGSKAIATILTKSPRLRVLEIFQSFPEILDPEVSQALEPVPSCFESQLKTIVVHCPCPAEVNLDWIALLLKKATALEEMVLYYVKTKEGKKNLKRLKKLPRGSNDCKISLLARSWAMRNA